MPKAWEQGGQSTTGSLHQLLSKTELNGFQIFLVVRGQGDD